MLEVNVQVLPALQKRIHLPAYISQAVFFEFALRTVAVAATATVPEERCSLQDDWHIKSKNA